MASSSKKMALVNVHVLVLLFLAILDTCNGTYFRGNLTVETDWQVLAQFVFDEAETEEKHTFYNPGGVRALPPVGVVSGQVFVEHDSALVFYDDDFTSWPLLLNNHEATCSDAVSLTENQGFAQHVIKLRGDTVTDVNYIIPGKNRPSTWRIAVARCKTGSFFGYGRRRTTTTTTTALTTTRRRLSSGSTGLTSRSRFGKYNTKRSHHYHAHRFHHLGSRVEGFYAVGNTWIDLHVKRADSGSSEFPSDEVMLLPGTFIYWTWFLGLVLFAVLEYQKALKKSSMTSLLVFQVILGICTLELIALTLSLIELLSFSASGIEYINGISFLRLFGTLFENMARIATIFLLVFLGTGWMILSPRLRDAECVAQFAWILTVFYLIAMIGTFLFQTSPNFTDEFHGILWLFVLVFEAFILAFAFGYAMHTALCSEKLKSVGRRSYANGENASIQARTKFMVMISVACLIALIFLENILLAVISYFVESWQRVDWVFMVSTFAHFTTCAALVLLFRPWRLEVLQSTRAATKDKDSSAYTWKAHEYGEEEDDIDFEGITPLMGDDDDDDYNDDDYDEDEAAIAL